VSDPRVVDVHVHLFEQADDPMRDGYEIWEYGERDGVAFGTRRGTVEDLAASLGQPPVAHCVIVGMFAPGAGAPSMPAADRLRSYNDWVLQAAEASPHLTALVAADPSALGGAAGADYLRECADKGARGIKIHPIVQGFAPTDPRLDPIYETCVELGLTVLSHSGQTRGSSPAADPFAFAPVMERFPDLHLLLAHLGGASWRQVAPFAAAYPAVSFDLCEIIAWTGAPGAPSADELGRLIRGIGSERVLFGTDFPWYELDRTVDQLMALPHLSDEERRGILGENAIRRMGLTVADSAP
jgi:predicted TIM-barrel fold metal-dependent hydrolase